MQAAEAATKRAVQAVSEAAGPTERSTGAAAAASMSARPSRPSLRQLTFNWKV